MAKVRILGLDEMDAFFKDLSRMDQKKVIIKAFKIAVGPIERQMRFNAPERGLKESIGTVQLRKKIGVKVGARVSRGKRGQWGLLYDIGTKRRYRYSKNNAPTGMFKGNRWFTNAVERMEDLSTKKAIGEYYSEIDRRMKRYVRKVNKEFTLQ